MEQPRYKMSIWMALTILFSSCSITEKGMGIAYLHTYKSDSLEIEIPYNITSYGNLHSISFKKWHSRSSDWIYISRLEKKVTSDKLIFSHTKDYSTRRNLKGEIAIKDSILTINLKLPYYKRGIIKRWTDYKLNGTYKMEW